MKRKLNQKGFGAIELIIILVILIAIGAVGYVVYAKHHKTTYSSSASQSSNTTSTASSGSTVTGVDSYSSWSSIPASMQQTIVSLGEVATPKNAGCGPVTLSDIQADTDQTNSSGVIPSVFVEKDQKFVIFPAVCGQIEFNYLGAYTGGSWQVIAGESGGSGYGCSLLTQYNVPTDLLIKSGTSVVTSGAYQCSAPPTGSETTASYQAYYGPTSD